MSDPSQPQTSPPPKPQRTSVTNPPEKNEPSHDPNLSEREKGKKRGWFNRIFKKPTWVNVQNCDETKPSSLTYRRIKGHLRYRGPGLRARTKYYGLLENGSLKIYQSQQDLTEVFRLDIRFTPICYNDPTQAFIIGSKHKTGEHNFKVKRKREYVSWRDCIVEHRLYFQEQFLRQELTTAPAAVSDLRSSSMEIPVEMPDWCVSISKLQRAKTACHTSLMNARKYYLIGRLEGSCGRKKDIVGSETCERQMELRGFEQCLRRLEQHRVLIQEERKRVAPTTTSDVPPGQTLQKQLAEGGIPEKKQRLQQDVDIAAGAKTPFVSVPGKLSSAGQKAASQVTTTGKTSGDVSSEDSFESIPKDAAARKTVSEGQIKKYHPLEVVAFLPPKHALSTPVATKTPPVAKPKAIPPRQYRQTLPHVMPPAQRISAWSMAKMVGTGLTMNFFEPLDSLQRMCEGMEYSELLDRAVTTSKDQERLVWIAAFIVSQLAGTGKRTLKPFNPLLGTSFAMDRMEDRGWRFLGEQVGHSPNISVCYVEGKAGWAFSSNLKIVYPLPSMSGTLQVLPQGFTEIIIESKIYRFAPITMSIQNITDPVKRCVTHSGTIKINVKDLANDQNEYLGGVINCKESGECNGKIFGQSVNPPLIVEGSWLDQLNCAYGPIQKQYGGILFKAHPMPPDGHLYYGFGMFTRELNELFPADKLPPTDSRLRPDVRMLENGKLDEALEEKKRLEKAQRLRKESGVVHYPQWFEKQPSSAVANDVDYKIRDRSLPYWKAMENNFKDINNLIRLFD